MSVKDKKIPQFALIKQFLEQQIKSRQWEPGRRIPTEQSLADTFSVSRMTARRAVQELADAGLLERTQGSGTFVADAPKSIPNIPLVDVVGAAKAEHTHRHKMISVDAIQATSDIAKLMGLQTDTLVFQLTVLHLNSDRPIQWQKIWVNRFMAPALLKQKLDKIDPNDYLNWLCRPQKTDYQVKAVLPSASQRLQLMLSNQDTLSCMQLSRREWSGDSVLSFSVMLHPANSYYLGDDLEEAKS
ncbi:MAG: GntR family transcriptional regulator [Porticoccaceae bacterium]|nr:GntR family transcriptional regulator [Porticoccaceae bacterium]